MARAMSLRSSSVRAGVIEERRRPSSQVMVSSRLVESSGTTSGTRIESIVQLKISRVEPRVACLEIDSRAPLGAAPRSPSASQRSRSPGRSRAWMREQHAELG